MPDQCRMLDTTETTIEGFTLTSTKSTRACLITNPKAGKKGIDLKRVLPVLAEHGWEVEVREKRHGGHATELARKAVSDGFDLIVACGGEGTEGQIFGGEDAKA